MPETAGRVTKILNPERPSHPNRLFLLFGPFTWEMIANQHWKSTFLCLIWRFFILGSTINTHVVWVQAHAQPCQGVSCATEAAASSATSTVAAGRWWQRLSQGKEGWPFYSTGLALRGAHFHFCPTYANLGGLGYTHGLGHVIRFSRKAHSV